MLFLYLVSRFESDLSKKTSLYRMSLISLSHESLSHRMSFIRNHVFNCLAKLMCSCLSNSCSRIRYLILGTCFMPWPRYEQGRHSSNKNNISVRTCLLCVKAHKTLLCFQILKFIKKAWDSLF